MFQPLCSSLNELLESGWLESTESEGAALFDVVYLPSWLISFSKDLATQSCEPTLLGHYVPDVLGIQGLL